MDDNLNEKISKAIKLLWSTCNDEVELCYSGGKDSDVILKLADIAGIKFKPVYKCTTIDPPGTISHVVENNVEIVRPEKPFFQLIEESGFPTLRCRFCCRHLKEYKIMDKAILGIRKYESVKRNKRYKEPVVCRHYSKSEKVQQILPILYWTDKDIYDFIKVSGIKLAPHYYDSTGTIKKTRLGCMGCPLKSDRGLSDFKHYPKLVSAWISHGLIWWNTHDDIKSKEKFESVYDLFCHNIFFDSYESFRLAKTNAFGTIDCKKFLSDYFSIKL